MKIYNVKLYLFKIASCITLLAIITGCPPYYRYAGTIYYTPEEALAAQKNALNNLMAKIKPTEKKYGGSAAFIIPTFETFSALGIKKTGVPQKDQADYVGNLLVGQFRALFDCVDKRKIFDKVTLIEADYALPMVKKVIAEYDSVIYLNLVGPGQAQWFIRSSPEYKNIPLDSDKSTAMGVPRIMSWLDNIEKALIDSGYKLKR